MDELILRVLSGKATRFEKERLKRWRAESLENESRVQELSRLWELTSLPNPPEASVEDVQRLAESIVAKAEARRSGGGSLPREGHGLKERRGSIRSLAPWGLALAAGFAAVALGIRALDSRSGPPGIEQSTPSIALSSQTLRLDDGSYVRLSPGSRLEASLGKDQRSVTLDGKAFFAVAPDGGRPFLVRTEAGEVLVLGTRFEIAQEDRGIRTVVVEGRVALHTSDGRVEVPKGSVGEGSPGSRPTVRAVDDVLSLLDWPGGLLVFHETPLRDVVREVERHFRLPVRAHLPESRTLTVSASFEEGESFEEVLETLCSVTRSQCRISADSAVIGSPPGEAP
jgi:transmembrane sensor